MDFIELLQFSMGIEEKVPDADNVNWEAMLATAKKQSLAGVIYYGIGNLPKEQRPEKKLLLKWYMLAEKIKQYNQTLNELAVRTVEQYTADGFLVCLLKGQGNALMYPDPMMRNPGDIDLWVKPEGEKCNIETIRKAVNEYVKAHYKNPEFRYYHAEYAVDKISVEAHYMPSIMNNPIYNKRLQRWFSERMDEQCQHVVALPDGVGQIPVPTFEFNVVFQLSHMMHHYFDEGIGLRQMMDYYYLLKSDGRSQMADFQETLKYLNLYKFAGAVMYVMQRVFKLEEAYMLAPVDEKRGKSLLREIAKGGNFGKYSGLTKHGTGLKYLLKNWRSLQAVREYPAEALSEPLFRTWHFLWRFMNK